MRRTTLILLSPILVFALSVTVTAQQPSAQQEAQAQTSFETANSLLERGKHTEGANPLQAKARDFAKRFLRFSLTRDSLRSALRDFAFATDVWQQLKAVAFAMWKSGKPAELKERPLKTGMRGQNSYRCTQTLGKMAERDKEREELASVLPRSV